MTWSYLRRDFLPSDATCVFCHRPLHSEQGIVIADGDGTEAYTGPSCAKKHLGQPEERLLDVTSLALLVVADEPAAADPASAPTPSQNSVPNDGAESKARTATSRPPLPPLDAVVQYVRFRCELMTDFKFAVSKTLKQAHDEYKATGAISEGVEKMVAGAMRNASTDNTVLSPANVKLCIGFDHWLKEAVQYTSVERREFLESMLFSLHRYWSLSAGQIAGINKWGAHVRKRHDDFPLLDENVFAGVVLPDFMRRKA
ncbi:hypothetical protein [Pseudomonas nitroreducens]|uniref:hypothetical protein n=1 Tax=Pseudomonas nitroreducens TaxID=46680 RepID=UPI00351D9C40